MEKKIYNIAKGKRYAKTEYVDSYTFGCSYRPKVEFKLWYESDNGFFIKMTCYEENPKAIFTNYMDPVYKDSNIGFTLRNQLVQPI